MASFTLSDELQHPADFALVRDGGIALYLGTEVLGQAQAGLTALGYSDVRLDLGDGDLERLHDEFSRALSFPGYYGRNFAALNDCLGDVARGDYGWDASATGLALVLNGFGRVHERHPREATVVADILVGMSRYGLLFGHRIVSLLHVDTSRVSVGPVGAIDVPWNHRQWLISKRVADAPQTP